MDQNADQNRVKAGEVLSRMPSVVTGKLIELLKGGKVGDVLMDERMMEVCGQVTMPNHPGYANLQSAIRYCLREYGMVWGRVWKGNCIKCLNSREVAEAVSGDVRRIHRRARQAVRKGATVRLGDIADGERGRFLVEMAVAGTIAMETNADTRKKLVGGHVTKPLDLSKLLEAYKENM